jgi:hypothetical protein
MPPQQAGNRTRRRFLEPRSRAGRILALPPGMTTPELGWLPDDALAQMNSASKTQGQPCESADQRLIAWRRAVTAHRLGRVVLPSVPAASSRIAETVLSV